VSLKFGAPRKCNADGTVCSACKEPIELGAPLCIAFPGKRPHCITCASEVREEPKAAKGLHFSVAELLRKQEEILKSMDEKIDIVLSRTEKRSIFPSKGES
jgi:hypothetical protein